MTTSPHRWWRRRSGLWAAVAGVGLAGAYAWGVMGFGPATVADGETAEVVRGEFVDLVTLRGDVKARRSVLVAAPSGAGELQVVALARNGSEVKAGDIVVQFDPTTVERSLAEKRSALRQASAEIEQARAQARLREEATRTNLAKARFDVDRATLDVGTREVVSRLDAEKAVLKLGEAQQKVRELEATVEADRAAARAELAGLEQKRDKAHADVSLDEGRLKALTVKAPSDGLVILGRNWRAGPFAEREWRQGDRAWAGAVIGELPELASPYVAVKIDEIDRGRLQPGMDASVLVEALPGVDLAARIESFSTLAKPDFNSWPPPRLFDVSVELLVADARLRPGMTASVRVPVARLPGTLLVPTRAVMQVGGEPSVYVLGRRGFERRSVVVLRRGQEQVALGEGVREGERVALADPTRPAAQGAR